MKRYLVFMSILVIVVTGASVAIWAATNETVSVQAKQKDNPQQNPSDVEGRFQQNPTGDKDEIHVTNDNAKGEGAGVYNDPVNDGALLTIAQESGPVKVDVEGREGIGAMYWVTVIPGGGGGTGGGGEKVILWADVEDLKAPGALVLKDKLTEETATDRTDEPSDAPMLYCPIADDGKSDVEFWLVTQPEENRTYEWSISQGGTAVASGYLNRDNSYKVSKDDLPVGLYSLDVTLNGDNPRKINFAVFQVTMGRILKGTSEQTVALVVGEDYSFEYTLEPAGITLPSLTFRLAHSISPGGSYVAVHKADLTNVTSGLHTETWQQTKWTVDHVGAYANPKNGSYGAFCTYTLNSQEYRISSTKAFTTQLVIETKLDDAAPTNEISSGLYQPDHKPVFGSPQIQIGLKPQSGDPVFGSKDNLTFSSKTMTDMDGDNTTGDQGKEVQDIMAKQIMQDVDAGTYTVVIKGLCDVAGNDGPGGSDGIISDWTLHLE